MSHKFTADALFWKKKRCSSMAKLTADLNHDLETKNTPRFFEACW